MELGKVIAINLKQLRTERNLTLGQLSKISGISKAMLSDIEKGNSNPTINTIWKIAQWFECAVYEAHGRNRKRSDCDPQVGTGHANWRNRTLSCLLLFQKHAFAEFRAFLCRIGPAFCQCDHWTL